MKRQRYYMCQKKNNQNEFYIFKDMGYIVYKIGTNKTGHCEKKIVIKEDSYGKGISTFEICVWL